MSGAIFVSPVPEASRSVGRNLSLNQVRSIYGNLSASRETGEVPKTASGWATETGSKLPEKRSAGAISGGMPDAI